MKSDKELYKIWEKYIDVPIYRVIPIRDYKIIKKNGINPKRDKYKNLLKIKKLLKIVNKLEKKGFVIRYGSRKASLWLTVTIHDLNIPYIDFAPRLSDVEYYLKLKGGACAANIGKVTKDIIKSKQNLTKKESIIVNNLHKWAKSRKCKNITILVMGNCKCFETAKFQLIRRGKGRKKYEKPKYLESPFGSFEHFKKVIKKQGYIKYASRLKSGKYYLRVKDKIPAKESSIFGGINP